MKTLEYKIEISAKPEKIWQKLWNKDDYTTWTTPFAEGCYYENESFSEDSAINFLAPSGDGMISKIVSLKPNEYVAFEHLAMKMNGVESAFKEENDTHNYIESYELIENDGKITLIAKVDTLEPWVESMNNSFPKALEIIKQLSEK